MASDIVGSWFPTGYHGHFRSKSRNDFLCEYRQMARPQPPKRFYNRAMQPTRKHVFSHHDNRQAFLNDALIFQQGLGRRRVPNSTYQFKQDFMAWMPEREYIERSRPLTSTYKVDFNRTEESKRQLITKRPKTSFDGVPTTSYRYAHGEEAPNKAVINAMNNDALKLSLLNRKDRAMSAKYATRETVATCLTWTNKKNGEPVRPIIPPATQTTTYEPHPPSQPKPPSPMTSVPPIQEENWPKPAQAPPADQAPVVQPPPPVQAPPQIQQAPPPQQVLVA